MTIPSIAPYPMPEPEQLGLTPPRWTPDPRRAVLLIHDMQEYFLRFYEHERAPLRELSRNLARLRAACREHDVPVVYTQQPADPERARRGLLNDVWGPGLVRNPEQASILPALAPQAGDRVLEKTRYSAFFDTELLELLRHSGRDQLWIGGVYAHIGCMLTAAHAFMHDVRAFLVADACADFDRAAHEQALRYVAGRCGAVTWTDALLQCFSRAEPAALVRAELSRLLGLPAAALAGDPDLRELGLDSVRLMELGETLQTHGYDVQTIELMECRTVNALIDCAGSART
jgi:bifunctional isochorismate lyase / aryl carrier protein